MQGYFSILAFVTMIVFVLFRSRQMKKLGIKAMHFGKMDKKDFFIPPFVLLYFYLIIANTFDLPRFGNIMDDNPITAWIGTIFCTIAPGVFLWGMVSFGKSFRVGIDEENPCGLVSSPELKEYEELNGRTLSMRN